MFSCYSQHNYTYCYTCTCASFYNRSCKDLLPQFEWTLPNVNIWKVCCKICSATKEKPNCKGNYIVDCFNKRLLILNVFSSQKLNIRKTMLAKSSVLTDKTKKLTLIPELMSSEESDDSDDGNASFIVHFILWRSDKFTNYLYWLD